MKTASIIAAIYALKAADRRLADSMQDGWRQGDTSLATECFKAAAWLEAQLIEQFPDVQVKEAA